MSKPIIIIAEQKNEVFRKVTFEIAGQGRKLADELDSDLLALVIGKNVEGIAADLGQYGVDKAYVFEGDQVRGYEPGIYTDVITRAIRALDPQIILLPATSMGKDLGPRLAGRLEVGLATDCVNLAIENGNLVAIRPMFAGKVTATNEFSVAPQMVSIRPNIFPAEEVKPGARATIERLEIEIDTTVSKTVVKDLLKVAGTKVDLTEASIIVAGGRGMKGPENYKILEELAEVLGGAVAASRAAVDADWRPHSEQVGQTGKTVSPDLYIACGISGAIQHLAGMSGSKCIVAINKDPEAPIFEKADYGIVGDVLEVVPALTTEFKKILGK